MDDVVRVSRSLSIPRREVSVRTSPSGGPGGQHANRSQTRVELRFDVAASPSLGPRQRARLLERLGREVRVVCDEERSQARNREIAFRRLAARLASALQRDPPRHATRPTRASQRRRVERKRRRGELKRGRSAPPADD